MKKRIRWIAAAVLVACAVAGGAAYLFGARAPSYEKILQLNDDLKQARQLGLASQEKCAERLGAAILKTTDETVLAKLLSTASFEERYANAILAKIKDPKTVESIAQMFKPELFSASGEQGAKLLYDAVLNRLPDDSAVERVVTMRVATLKSDSGNGTLGQGKTSLGEGCIAASLCRRICEMADKERSEALLEKVADSGVLHGLSSEANLDIALRTKNEKIRRATGADEGLLELGDLVGKWDPNFMSRSVQDIVNRGREIRQNMKYAEIVEQFNPAFRGDRFEDWVLLGKRIENAREYIEIVRRVEPDYVETDIDKWVEYGRSLMPVLESLDRLAAKEKGNSTDSARRIRLVEKRDKAREASKEWRDLREKISSNPMAALAACQQFGISFDPSDPYDSEYAGTRLGTKIRQLIESAEREAESAERELAALDRESSSKTAEISREKQSLQERLKSIRQRYETPETRAAKKTKVKNAVPAILASMVSIAGKDYRMGKTEVTQAQWEAVMGDNPSRFKGADNPVECVSWDDCQEFLRKLNELPEVQNSGLVFRLPTDTEWEYACRAGATGKFCKLADGTEITEDTLGRVAWFEDSEKGTHPVGQKEPNAFGLYDMHGNVWEWCQNEIGEVWDYAKGKDYEHHRVLRGGCWLNSAGYCESSYRSGRSPVGRNYLLGFRLCASGRAD